MDQVGLLLDSLFFKGDAFVYLTNHLLLDSLFLKEVLMSIDQAFCCLIHFWLNGMISGNIPLNADNLKKLLLGSNDIPFLESWEEMLSGVRNPNIIESCLSESSNK